MNPWIALGAALVIWANGYLTGCILTNRKYTTRFKEMTQKFNELTADAERIRADFVTLAAMKGPIQ